MKPKDDNDLLRNGALPRDPFKDAVPVGRAVKTDEGDEDSTPLLPWPDPPHERVFRGLAGKFVRLVAPFTESDSVALLVQALVAFGNVIGRGPHFRAEADKHFTNEDAAFVGETAKGRKGTSWGRVKDLLSRVDPDWLAKRVLGGLSTGEGLIWAVRNPIEKKEPVREHGVVTRYQTVIDDHGVDDKRALFLESEFASVLRILKRDGNTLSAVVRHAWDDGDLQTSTKNSPARATGALVSIISHVTKAELLCYLDRTELGNGFANRFLWFAVRRSKILPSGGCPPAAAVAELAAEFLVAVEKARRVGELRRDPAAEALWREVYEDLSSSRPGILGAVTARAEAHVMRLACLYALLDGEQAIGSEHLEAALALWKYSDASVQWIFGQTLGDPRADRILAILQGAPPSGLKRSEIRARLADHHIEKSDLDRALRLLYDHGLARVGQQPTAGRSAEVWFATGKGNGNGKEGIEGKEGGAVPPPISPFPPFPPTPPEAPEGGQIGGAA